MKRFSKVFASGVSAVKSAVGRIIGGHVDVWWLDQT